MNVVDFIKKYTIEKAREVVDGAPESGQPLYFNTVNSVYFFTGCRNRYFIDGVWGNEDEHPSMYNYDIRAVSLTHLKRLVESVDLIKFYDGIEKARFLLEMSNRPSFRPPHVREVQLKQAIVDYETIYGVNCD